MKDETLILEKTQPLAYKIGRHKGAVAACMVVVFVACALLVSGALWWKHPLLFTAMPLLFLATGIVHTLLLEKYLHDLTGLQKWLFTTASTLAVFLLLSCSSWWNIALSWRSILASCSSFFLPFTIIALWREYANIAYSNLIPWQAPDVAAKEYPSAYLTSIPVRFRIIQEPDHANKKVAFLSSLRMPLGEVFLDMVQKQNKKELQTISLKGWEDQPYSWVFYTSDMLLWRRPLDPAKSLRENNIRKNATIYAQRVSGETLSALRNNELNSVQP